MFGSVRKNVFNDGVQVDRNRDRCVRGGERRIRYRSRIKGGKNNGCGRKEVSPVALNKARCGTHHCNNQVGRMGGEKRSQIV